jgi:hypothetical protein
MVARETLYDPAFAARHAGAEPAYIVTARGAEAAGHSSAGMSVTIGLRQGPRHGNDCYRDNRPKSETAWHDSFQSLGVGSEANAAIKIAGGRGSRLG